jgi:hypothetical protein
VGFSDSGLDIVDPDAGDRRRAARFLAVLGASNLTYASDRLDYDRRDRDGDPGEPNGAMTYAFLSYVRENQAEVERLRDALARYGIHSWLDREAIEPGASWQEALRSAIARGDFFLACFSRESQAKADSYMDVELRLAVEQLDRRKDGWLIPLRLSDCSIPDLPAGRGRNLRDLQWIDLFSDWERGVRRIVDVIRPLWLLDEQRQVRSSLLEEGCRRHVESKLRLFAEQGAMRLQEIEARWRGLVEGDCAAAALEACLSLFDRATSANTPMTEQIIEPGPSGRVILLSAVPTFDGAALLDHLRRENAQWSSYLGFIQERRRAARTLPSWRGRDLVHWIYRQERPLGEMEIDLLYLCGYDLMLEVMAFRSYLSDKTGAEPPPLEQIYPTTLMTTLDMRRLFADVLREEASLAK